MPAASCPSRRPKALSWRTNIATNANCVACWTTKTRLCCQAELKMSTKVIITGSKGRMGQALTSCAGKIPGLEIVAGVDKGNDLSAVIGKCDVVIDFSAHAA